MATIRTAIQIQDGMSPAFRSMNTAMNIVINSFEALQTASHNTIDTASIQAARNQLAKAEVAINKVENEVRQVNQETKKMPENFNRAKDSVEGLKNKVMGFAAGLGLAFGGTKVLGISDEMANTAARLDLIKGKGETVAELQERIFQSAKRSRGEYVQTASTVAKLGLLAKDAFSSNDETIYFAELMNKSFKLSGASISEASNGMYQLTQAMAAGRLQGDEFRSVMENAPMLAQAIAKYTGKSMGELKEMSADGVITADIIKNAMFSAADDINAKFKTMPTTWGQVWTSIKNQSLKIFQPILAKINELANNEKFNKVVNGIIGGLSTIEYYVAQAFGIAATVGSFIYDNWSYIEPIVWGIVAAVGAYAAIQGIATLMTLGSAAAEGIKAAALLVSKIVTWDLTAAQWGLNASLLACPITWIVLVIAAVVAAIVIWINKVGGLKVAWLMAVNAVLTAWDTLKQACTLMVNNVLDKWDTMLIGISMVAVGVQNALGDMKANGLMILQGFVNGAIDLINGLITSVNNITGTSIETIQHVTFGAEARIEEDAKKKARGEALEKFIAEKDAAKKLRDEALKVQAQEAYNNAKAREANINKVRAEAAENAKDNSKEKSNKDPSFDPSIAPNVADTAKNTGAMKDAMDISNEDLKYMRDIAEQEVINRFTTAEIKVDMTNNNSITKETDFDGVVSYLENKIYETMEVAAEGVHS